MPTGTLLSNVHRGSPLLSLAVAFAIAGLPARASADQGCDLAAGTVYAPAQGTNGLVLFEDLWPDNGDLDFNDQSIAFNYEFLRDSSGGVVTLRATFNVLAVGATLHSGAYLHLPLALAGSAVSVVDQDNNVIQPILSETDLVIPIVGDTRSLFADQYPFINTQAGTAVESGTPITLTITFANGAALDASQAPFDLFIARNGDYPHQIHLPQYPGTQAMAGSTLFGSGDDRSNVDLSGHGGANNRGRWFVNAQGLPFALAIPEIIDWPKETIAIDRVYPDITTFGTTAGTLNTDWYEQDINSALAFTHGLDNVPPPAPQLPAADLVCIPHPPAIVYAPDTLTCTLGADCALLAPDNSGGTIVSFSIAPSLPAGLSIDDSGAISGIPTTLSTSTIYTVTATNTGGSTTATVTVTVNDVAPGNLMYIPNAVACILNAPCSLAGPANSGGAVVTYSISPTLPSGLSIVASSGALTGTSTVLSPATTYTVTATNSGGSTSTTVTVTVNDVVPSALTYSPPSIVCIVGQPCSIPAPTNSGGVVVSYTASPSLPPGLTLSPSTGALSGTASTVAAPVSCLVTATNTGGSTTATLTITIDAGYIMGTSGFAAGGLYHTCAMAQGGVLCWGQNADGQLGNGTTNTSLVATAVENLSTGVQAISSQYLHTCAVVNGAAECWGYNADGELGNNSTSNSTVPVPVQGLSSGVDSISANFDHSCAVVNGGAWCWGSNSNGQLGNGTTINSQIPVQVSGLSSGVQQIVGGRSFSCALANGGVQCWGLNTYGNLGNNTTTESHVPVRVSGLTNGVQALSSTLYSACAQAGGAVKCWGDNTYGELGNSGTANSSVPVQVTGLTIGVRAIAAGYFFNCALLPGGIECWGSNLHGQLGNGSTATRVATPVVVSNPSAGVQAIAGGWGQACALVNGAVECWGYDADGELGNNSTANSLSAVQVLGLNQGIAQIASGGVNGYAVLNGAVVGWGSGAFGGLGNGSNNSSDVPAASQITSGTAGIAAGDGNTCALATNGDLECWGYGAEGQVGDNSTATSLVPAPVTGLSIDAGVAAVYSGPEGEGACALVNGGAECWGWNNNGQLGINSTANSKVPVKMTGLGNPDAGVQSLALNASDTCAVVNGGVECTGLGLQGELGNNSTATSKVPVAVTSFAPGDGGVQAITLPLGAGCALANGGVYCWGTNTYGELGNGTTTNSLVPVPVTGLGSGVQSIAAAWYAVCAVVNGGVECWGQNSSGQLGNDTTTDSPVPTPVSGLSSGVSAISGGDNWFCAVVNGGVQCWGGNNAGQLGNGSTIESNTPANVVGLTYP